METEDILDPVPVTETTQPAIAIGNIEQAEAVTRPFVESLEKLDTVRGTSLADVFRECVKIHSSNSILRANMNQMQTVLQDNLSQWAMIRGQIGKQMTKLEPGSKKYIETMKGYLELSEKTNKMTIDTAKLIKDIKKEIRMTELGDQYHYHVSQILQFFSGLTAILFKELQTSPQLDRIMDGMNDLAKVFRIEEHK